MDSKSNVTGLWGKSSWVLLNKGFCYDLGISKASWSFSILCGHWTGVKAVSWVWLTCMGWDLGWWTVQSTLTFSVQMCTAIQKGDSLPVFSCQKAELSSLQPVGLPLIVEQEIASLNRSAYKIFPLHSATCIHEAVLAALSFYSFVSIGLVFIVQMGPSLTYASIECMHRIELFFFFTETTLLFKWIEICSFCAVKKIQHSVIFVIFVSINDMLLNNWDLHL